jgi:hypothetical protein
MTISYEWTWGPMEAQNIGYLESVVTNIHWVCKATDDSTMQSTVQSGIMRVTPPDSNVFVAISNVTLDMVQNWTASGLDKSIIENRCADILSSGLPPDRTLISIPT